MQRSTHYHPSWCSCSISPYCALGLQAPWDAAVYHFFWNEKILLKSLSHTGFPCSSPLNSLPLLLLASTSRRELQDHTAKGWHLQGTLTLSGLFYCKMQSVIKYLSSHLTSEAQGVQSASVVELESSGCSAEVPWAPGWVQHPHTAAAGSPSFRNHQLRAAHPVWLLWGCKPLTMLHTPSEHPLAAPHC